MGAGRRDLAFSTEGAGVPQACPTSPAKCISGLLVCEGNWERSSTPASCPGMLTLLHSRLVMGGHLEGSWGAPAGESAVQRCPR